MNGIFISPFIYADLFSDWLQGKCSSVQLAPTELYSEFLSSSYKRVLVTISSAEALLQETPCVANQLCIAFHLNEYPKRKELLVRLKSQGAVIILLTSETKAIAKLSEPAFFDEIVFFVRKNLGKSDFDKLFENANLRLLFLYGLSQEAVVRVLKLYPEKKLVSEYLELSPKSEVELWYSPCRKVLAQSSVDLSSGLSVIVPFQENHHELKTCLGSLCESLKQDSNFEILLVDDGHGPDCLQELAAQFPDLLKHITYIKLERTAARVRGDDGFRAGVARNMGASLSRGTELVFLDSDILLGSDFWKVLQEKRKLHSDPLMPRRRQLLFNVKVEGKTHKDFNVAEDTQLSWGGHWERFYRDWLSETHVWRWTSTYCLCLPRDVFMALGGFHRAFYCYGFEDTELGYRLYKADFRLQIIDVDVYHLPVAVGRSEYQAEPARKQQILRQSFQVLLRATLDPQLVDLFQHVIGKR